MSPWFDQWYRQQLSSLHEKLKDPEEVGFWMMNRLQQAGPPPAHAGPWRQAIEEAIASISPSPSQEKSPAGWDNLPPADQEKIKHFFAKPKQLKHHEDGEILEHLLNPLISGGTLGGEKALWIWQYLLGEIGLAEENLMRHWVDAEQENLEAFEERYELHEQIKRIPGTLVIDAESAWRASFPDALSIVPDTAPRLIGKPWLVGALLLVTIAAIAMVIKMKKPEKESVSLSKYLSVLVSPENKDIALRRNRLDFTGEVQLTVGVKDSIRMLGGVVIFDPGIYHIALNEELSGYFIVSEGHMKAFLGEEVFVLESGMKLEKESGSWCKSWE